MSTCDDKQPDLPELGYQGVVFRGDLNRMVANAKAEDACGLNHIHERVWVLEGKPESPA